MNEWVGHVQAVATSRTLWLVFALPLAGALAQALLREKAALRAGLVMNAGALVAAIAHAVLLARMPERERFLLEHLWRLVRVGQLDVNLDLALDPLGAVACVAIASVGVVAERVAPSRSPWRGVVVGATLLLVLADGVVVVLVASALASVGVAALARVGEGAGVFIGAAAADVPLALGAALLFWALGGGWTAGTYTPDLNPRFVAARAASATTSPQAATSPRDDDDDDEIRRALPGEGTLTLTALPGAIVFVDEARVPILVGDRPLRSPFVGQPIKSGLHTFRVHGGVGVDDYVVSRVLVDGGVAIDLALVGPTLTFRELRDQLSLRPERGGTSPREALARRAIADASVVRVASLLFFVAIAWRLVRLATGQRDGDQRMLVAIVSLVAAVYLAARLAFVTSLAHGGGVAAVASLVLAVAVARVRSNALGALAGTYGLVALAALALGAHANGVLVALVASAALAALHLGGGRGGLFARAALAGAPVPFVGASWPLVEVATSALDGRAAAPLPGIVVAAFVAVAVGAASFAAWRAPASAAQDRAGVALGALALALGPALAGSRRAFGESGEPLLEAWLAPVLAPRAGHASTSTAAAIALVAFGAALAGWALARRAGPAQVTERRVEPALARAFLRLASFTTSLDRWVIDVVGRAGAGAVVVAAWAGARADDAVDAPLRTAADRAARGAPALHRLSSYRVWVYAAVFAAIVAVVLYSLARV